MSAIANTFNLSVNTYNRNGYFFIVLVGLLCGAGLMALNVGAVPISPPQSLALLFKKIGVHLPWSVTALQENVFWNIRLPRIMLAILVGGGLAISGAVMQGLFRNPLADPGLLGVSGGAALGAVSVIVLGDHLSFSNSPGFDIYGLSIAAFATGLLTSLLVYRLGKTQTGTHIATLLLAGIAIDAIARAGIGLLTYMADDVQLRSLTFWTMGSLGGATWESVGGVCIFILVPVFILLKLSKSLNLITLGEQNAAYLGINVERVKIIMIVMSACIVGAAVAIAGIIGFVGLVVPHLIRLLQGANHNTVLPGSLLLGAVLLLLADIVARTIVIPAELPIGIVTTIIGGPFFLFLLLRRRRSL